MKYVFYIQKKGKQTVDKIVCTKKFTKTLILATIESFNSIIKCNQLQSI